MKEYIIPMAFFLLGYIFGAINMWHQIKIYRKEAGLDGDII